MNVDAIRDALIVRLNTISGLRNHPRVPDALEPPAAFLSLNTVNYDDDFDGSATILFDLVLVVGGTDSPRGQEALDDYINNTGAKSVYAAVHGDPDLAGAAHSVRVVTADQMDRSVVVAGTEYVGVRFVIEVLAAA